MRNGQIRMTLLNTHFSTCTMAAFPANWMQVVVTISHYGSRMLHHGVIVWWVATAWIPTKSFVPMCTKWTTPVSGTIPVRLLSTLYVELERSPTERLESLWGGTALSQPTLSAMQRTREVCVQLFR